MRYYSSIAVDTTLVAPITASDTLVTVASTSGYPSQFPFTVVIDPDTLSEELVEVNSAAGTTWSVTRAFDSTTASSHAVGAVVKHVASAEDFREFQNFMASNSSTVAASVANTFLLGGM